MRGYFDLNRGHHVGHIIDPTELSQYTTRCKDGTYSRSKAPSACVYHQGVADYEAQPPGVSVDRDRPIEAHPAAVYLVPIEDISFDRQLFQNREEEYSEETVQRIIEAVELGTFKFEVFDPVLLWQHRNRLIVLSGHSRTEAFTRLANMGRTEFERIPAKIIEATKAEARQIALESNTLSTRETDVERAAYYRTLRAEGVPANEAEAEARKNEGRDAKRIVAYSYLNPAGLAMTALKALMGKDDTSQENMKNVANWIGSARMRYPELSNLHEDELYRWLIGGAYGRQYTNQRDFLQKVGTVIMQRTEFGRFDPDTALNIQNLGVVSPTERDYNARRAELMQSIRDMDKRYKATLQRLKDQNATQAEIDRIVTPLEMQLRTARQKLIDFDTKSTRPSAAARQELNLFAVAGLHRRRPTVIYL